MKFSNMGKCLLNSSGRYAWQCLILIQVESTLSHFVAVNQERNPRQELPGRFFSLHPNCFKISSNNVTSFDVWCDQIHNSKPLEKETDYLHLQFESAVHHCRAGMVAKTWGRSLFSPGVQSSSPTWNGVADIQNIDSLN